MKWLFIGIVAFIAVLDILLILGCAKLERMNEDGTDRIDRTRE